MKPTTTNLDSLLQELENANKKLKTILEEKEKKTKDINSQHSKNSNTTK